MKTLADITWCGRVIWSKPPEDFWRRVRWVTRCECCIISRRRRKPMVAGHRTCGSMGVLTGTACRWTRLHSPFCWWTCYVEKLVARLEIWRDGGPWYGGRRRLLRVMDLGRRRTVGKRTLGTLPS